MKLQQIQYLFSGTRITGFHILLRKATCLLLAAFFSSSSFANDLPDYDEIPVYVTIEGIGSFEVPAIIYGEKAYLSVSDLFGFLKVRTVTSRAMDSISVYLNGLQNPHIVDKKNNRAVIGEKMFPLNNNEIIMVDANLYLLSDMLGPVFGLDCRFNFRSLSIAVTTRLELPVIKEMRQEAMRNNIRMLRGELKADTSIHRAASLFHFGTADWSFINTKEFGAADNLRFNLTLGGVLAGGETTLSLNYDNATTFSEKQQYYLWRRVNNERRALRQVMVGKIFTQSISSIYSPVVGVQFTNTPTTYRRSFGNYVLSDRTEPNWTVELYVNNVLVNYTKADASGFFTFEVPLVYGNSAIKLRYYGPYGEERITEQNINIPFNFVPRGHLEYTVSGGMVEDSLHSRFSKANLNYGLGNRLTIGGGVEYLSSVTNGRIMPFVNVSARLMKNLLLSAEYMYNVRMKSILSYRLPSNLQVELTYSKYKEGQKAINNTFLEERKAVLSYPFRGSKISLFTRMSIYQIVLPSSKYTTAETLFSGVIFGVSTNFTTYALYNDEIKPYIYSNLSSTFRMPAKLIFTPQLQYEYRKKDLISLKGEVGKYLSYRGYLNVFYEKNYKSNFQSVGIGLRYDLSFAQIGLSARRNNKTNTVVQSARGSMVYNGATGYLNFNNRSNVGKGGILLVAFLDLNGNGRKDNDEPKAAGLRIHINAGRVHYNQKDTSVLVSALEAYTSYLVKLNTDGFESISWRIQKQTLSISINPNQVDIIEIPVSVTGEVSGNVYKKTGMAEKGMGRIIINVFNADSTKAGQTISEADGFFSLPGLAPGSYIAMIDQAQLQKLNLVATPPSIRFTISVGREGDVVENLKFSLADE